jgi:hypothetical protein
MLGRSQRGGLVETSAKECLGKGVQHVPAAVFARTFVNSIVFGALDEWPVDTDRFVEETVDLLLRPLLP